jgi:hypothetical protein
MGIPVLILGESGSGKSASLRNFTKDEIGVINVAGKPLPFKSDIVPYNVNKVAKQKNVDRYTLTKAAILKANAKTLVIDDSQYLMAFDSFDKAKEVGYGKFTDMAVNFEKLIEFCNDEVPDDKLIYFLHHCETNDIGKLKAKTIGKMLDSQITLEGLFSIVLFCETDGKVHKFITQSDGTTTAKSPMGLFETEIDNDLKAVDAAIREYYNIKE